MLKITDNLSLRRLKDCKEDYLKLEKWYQEEEIYSAFEQRKLNYNEIKKKYYPRTLVNCSVFVYMILLENKPIGIIQYKLITDEDKKLYKIKEKQSYEIDIFIGELNLHSKKIGQQVINFMSNYLFDCKKAKLLVMCPLVYNKKAIKCYQKCNYKIIREFVTTDTIGKVQKYVLMIGHNEFN